MKSTSLLLKLFAVFILGFFSFTQSGCVSLTREMWNHSLTEDSKVEVLDKYYVSSNNEDKIYIDWISSGNTKRSVEIDISDIGDDEKKEIMKYIESSKKLNAKIKSPLSIRDCSSVPKKSRKSERVDCEGHDDIYVESKYSKKIKVNTVKSLPSDIKLSRNKYVPSLELVVYKVNNNYVLEFVAKTIATPATLVVDAAITVISIPVAIVLLPFFMAADFP